MRKTAWLNLTDQGRTVSIARSLTVLNNVLQVYTQASMAGRALLVAGVLALACVASASVQSIELDNEGESLGTCTMNTSTTPLHVAKLKCGFHDLQTVPLDHHN